MQRLFDLRRDFVHQFGVVRKRALQPFATLSEFRGAVAVPRTALLDDFEVHAQIGHFAQARDAHTESDFEFALLERRRHLVLHDFHLRVETHHFVAVFDLRAATDVEAHRRVELQGVTTGGRFGTAKHHTDFFAQLVDEDARCVRLGDGRSDFAQRLAHQSRLQSHFVVAHVAFDFRFRRERRHRVDHDNINGRRTNKLIGDFQCLLAVVGLRDEQVVDVHAQVLRIKAIEGVLRIDEGRRAARLLCLGNGMNRQSRLTRRFRTVDFDDAATGVTAHTQGIVQTDRTRRNHFHVFDLLVAHFHDRTLAEILFDLRHRRL